MRTPRKEKSLVIDHFPFLIFHLKSEPNLWLADNRLAVVTKARRFEKWKMRNGK
jgi:hypothetical protein